MKLYRLVKTSLFVSMLALLAAACSDNIDLGRTDESKYQLPDANAAYIVDADSKIDNSILEFRQTGAAKLYVNTVEGASQNVTITLKYDQAVLNDYNTANGTNYKLLPQSLVNLSNNGTVQIVAGNKQSTALGVTVTTSDALELGTTYVVPISAEAPSANISLTNNGSKYLLFVRDLTKMPSPDKSTGIKIFNCIEVNDANPLNTLCFTLKNSGKLLCDAVILFSANINYSNETGRVYVNNNENVQHLLDNRDKYIKPLQDKGVKVIIGILGNHDRAAVNNLSDETSRLFAKELKVLCDTYQLDGVFFDDEYSSPIAPPPAGFVSPSNNAAARLVYECKKVMPDKLTCVYVYKGTSSFPTAIDGNQAGEYLDWALHDYRQGFDLTTNYPGLPKTRWGMYSGEYALNRYPTVANLTTIRTGGYGAHMIFAMDPNRTTNWANRQLPALQNIATYLFDDELVYDGKPYSKDW